MKRPSRCSGCGVVLKDRPASCPLCGAELTPREQAPPLEVDAEDYQDHVRALRDELKRLRGEPEAV
jgi:hypothetical protein